ncbi:hypothetical protein ACLOJK_011866 [Asimina triloba]
MAMSASWSYCSHGSSVVMAAEIFVVDDHSSDCVGDRRLGLAGFYRSKGDLAGASMADGFPPIRSGNGDSLPEKMDFARQQEGGSDGDDHFFGWVFTIVDGNVIWVAGLDFRMVGSGRRCRRQPEKTCLGMMGFFTGIGDAKRGEDERWHVAYNSDVVHRVVRSNRRLVAAGSGGFLFFTFIFSGRTCNPVRRPTESGRNAVCALVIESDLPSGSHRQAAARRQQCLPVEEDEYSLWCTAIRTHAVHGLTIQTAD